MDETYERWCQYSVFCYNTDSCSSDQSLLTSYFIFYSIMYIIYIVYKSIQYIAKLQALVSTKLRTRAY